MGFCLWGVFLYPWWRFCYSCLFQGTVVQSVPTLGKFLVFPNTWCKILQILCAILSKFARRIVSTCCKWCVLSNFARKKGTLSDQIAHLGAKIVKSCQNFRPSGRLSAPCWQFQTTIDFAYWTHSHNHPLVCSFHINKKQNFFPTL